MAAEVQPHRLAGAECLPKKKQKSIKRPRILPSTCLFTGFICVYLLLSLTCPRKMENFTLYPAKRNQLLLFTRFLDYGNARFPPGKNEQLSTSSLGMTNLVILLILAGDVEVNPGPQLPHIDYLVEAQQQQLNWLTNWLTPQQVSEPLLSSWQLFKPYSLATLCFWSGLHMACPAPSLPGLHLSGTPPPGLLLPWPGLHLSGLLPPGPAPSLPGLHLTGPPLPGPLPSLPGLHLSGPPSPVPPPLLPRLLLPGLPLPGLYLSGPPPPGPLPPLPGLHLSGPSPPGPPPPLPGPLLVLTEPSTVLAGISTKEEDILYTQSDFYGLCHSNHKQGITQGPATIKQELGKRKQYTRSITVSQNVLTKQQATKMFQIVNHAKVLWDPLIKPKGLFGGHLNIRSLVSKYEQIEQLLTNSNLHYLCLSETWLSSTSPGGSVNIAGYNVYRCDRNCGRGGGVLIYVKDSLQCEQIDIQENSLECVGVKITLSPQMSFLVFVLYRPVQKIYSMRNCPMFLKDLAIMN